MPLQIQIGTEAKVNFQEFLYNKDKAELVLNASEQGTLRLQVPFKMTKIPDRVFDVALDIENVLVLRNINFKEKSLVKLKYKVGDKNKVVGFIFSLRGITQADDVVEESKDVALYAARALVCLLHNKCSLPANIPLLNSSGEYQLSDFFDDDIVICIVSKEQFGSYSTAIELSILYHLNLYGFYLLNTDQNKKFQPVNNWLQREALGKIINSDSKGDLIIKDINQKIVNEPYFANYVTSIVNNPQHYIAKFFIAYQCYEILIDHITKAEISTKVAAPGAMDGKSGYIIKGTVMEIADEGYRIEKLFNHYATFYYESDYHVGFEIEQFFSNYKIGYESKPKPYGSYFYEMRNTLVHNLRICYTGTPQETANKLRDLELLITSIEFLVAETILGFNI